MLAHCQNKYGENIVEKEVIPEVDKETTGVISKTVPSSKEDWELYVGGYTCEYKGTAIRTIKRNASVHRQPVPSFSWK